MNEKKLSDEGRKVRHSARSDTYSACHMRCAALFGGQMTS